MSFKPDLNSMILAALHEGPRHGYLIAKYIREQSQNLLKVGESAIYPALQELEEKGLVTSAWEQQEGKPAKKIYSITDSGKGHFEEKVASWKKFQKVIDSMLIGSKKGEINNAESH